MYVREGMEKKDELETSEIAANEERTIVEDMMKSAMKNTASLAGRKRATLRPSSSASFRTISRSPMPGSRAGPSGDESDVECTSLPPATKPHAVLQNSVTGAISQMMSIVEQRNEAEKKRLESEVARNEAEQKRLESEAARSAADRQFQAQLVALMQAQSEMFRSLLAERASEG